MCSSDLGSRASREYDSGPRCPTGGRRRGHFGGPSDAQEWRSRLSCWIVTSSDSQVGSGSPKTNPSGALGALRADVGDDEGSESQRKCPRRERERGREAGERCNCDREWNEAEESPSHEGAVRARGEVSVELQGVQRLSAREEALSLQGVRWCINLRARSCAL